MERVRVVGANAISGEAICEAEQQVAHVFFRSAPTKVDDALLDIALTCGEGRRYCKAGDAHVRHRLNGIVQPVLKERRCAKVARQKNGKVLVSAISQLYEAQRPTFTHGKDVFSSPVPPEDDVACTRVVTALQNSISIFWTDATPAPHERAAKGRHPREAFCGTEMSEPVVHRRVPFQTRHEWRTKSQTCAVIATMAVARRARHCKNRGSGSSLGLPPTS
jgi:hypothetical protein